MLLKQYFLELNGLIWKILLNQHLLMYIFNSEGNFPFFNKFNELNEFILLKIINKKGQIFTLST